MARGQGSRKRWYVALAGLLILALAATGIVWWRGRSGTTEATSTTTTVAVTTQTLRQTVATTGTIAPKQRSDLSFPGAGTVTAVKVAQGDSVTAGQVLATMSSTDLQNAVTLAQANLDAANAQLVAAQSSGASDAQLASAQAQINAASAKLSTAQTNLAGTTLTAPFDGVVAGVTVTVGDRVGTSGGSGGSGSGGSGSGGAGGSGGSGGSGSSGSGNGTAAVTVIGRSGWVVNATVGSADLASLAKGLQAEIVPTGTAAKAFGVVSGVGVVATGGTGSGQAAGQAAASFPVVVEVTGTPAGLYAGGTATVSIIVKQVTDALVVPTAAIVMENGQTVVHQDHHGTVVSTPITVGMISGAVTQVLKGLEEGDEVLVETRGGVRVPGASGSRSGGTGPATRGGFGGGGRSS